MSQALYYIYNHAYPHYVSEEGNLTYEKYWELGFYDFNTGNTKEYDGSPPFKVLDRRRWMEGETGQYVGSKRMYDIYSDYTYAIDGKLYASAYEYSSASEVTFEIDLNDYSYRILPGAFTPPSGFSLKVSPGKAVNSIVQLSDKGIVVSGNNLISKESDGSISVGTHSVKFGNEGAGVQSMWATDADGVVDLNITNGTDLKINGQSVLTEIGNNETAIQSNDVDIAANVASIQSNDSDIAANVAAIQSNDVDIAENTSAIQSNDAYIAANVAAIQSHASDISELRVNSSSYQRQINDNKSAIRKNKKAIEINRANINSLGDGIAVSAALGAALSALPTTSGDSPFSCGVGTGGYSSRYAMSVGCAVKTSERLSFNAGGSYVFGGAADYGNGSLSNIAGRAGFVFKLGKSQSSSKGDLQSRVRELEDLNNTLMSRLERLEAIAALVIKN